MYRCSQRNVYRVLLRIRVGSSNLPEGVKGVRVREGFLEEEAYERTWK